MILTLLPLAAALSWAVYGRHDLYESFLAELGDEPSLPPRPQKYPFRSVVPAEPTPTSGEALAAPSAESAATPVVAGYAGVVRSDLAHAALSAGMDADLANKLAELFAWPLHGDHGASRGDRWRASVATSDDPTLGVSAIVAAQIEHGGHLLTVVRDSTSGLYFAPDGRSLQRSFLRSPLHHSGVTSGFSRRRFHPILKVDMPHLGVDFGAPVGTPVMSVGDGKIVEAGWHGGSGRMLVIDHDDRYRTVYKHLSRFALAAAPGQLVKKGEVIGYVGATGLATGPHLHFEFHDGERVLDPETAAFPAAKSVPDAGFAAFRAAARQALAELPAWRSDVLVGTAASRDTANVE